MSAGSTIVHLIYIHGFQGNDTTFRRFPTDVQSRLDTLLLQGTSAHHFKTRSCLYPTYKSVKPISHATKNFLEWLQTQAPGPAILLGHSMGGLLAADAATDPSQKAANCKHPIIGMIAFDTPYLGMHPHVVITGIASLFAKKDAQDANPANAETVMNDPSLVHFPNERITDDWDELKKDIPRTPSRHSHTSSTDSASQLSLPPPLPPRSPSPSVESQRSPLSPPIHPKRSMSPTPSASSSASHGFSKAFSMLPSSVKEHPSVQGFITSHADKPLVRWLNKHADDPFGASKTWVVERFQFGSCMFDVPDLKGRYARIVEWQWKGGWVNLWTITQGADKEARKKAKEEAKEKAKRDSKSLERASSDADQGVVADQKDNDKALLETGVLSASLTASSIGLGEPGQILQSPLPKVSTPSGSDEVSLDQRSANASLASTTSLASSSQEASDSKSSLQTPTPTGSRPRSPSPSPPRHFVVLPTGLGAVLGGGDHWDSILIHGAEDEVAAHLGMFMEDQNHGYEDLVNSVADRVVRWCLRAGV